MSLARGQRRLRQRYFGPYRRLLSTGCRFIYARGQLDTTPIVHLDALGLAAEGREEHAPSGWRFLRRALKGIAVTPDDVFVDFGSGMGRAVYLAARHYPFRRVVGVELSDSFNRVAKENIARMRPKLRCKELQFVTCDATEYAVPDDMTIAYFFNPFTGPIFTAVLDNIVESLERRPRPLTICYANPVEERAILATGRFVKVRESRGFRRDLPLYRIAIFRTR